MSRLITAAAAAAAAATSLVAAGAGVPQFPADWSAFVQSDLVQNQGNYELPNGDLCCSEEANQCQVQVQSSGGMVYFDLSHNRTANVYGAAYQPYAIIDDYNLGMEMAVDGTYTCTAYCPISGPLTAYSVAGATDMGPTIILNRKAEVWVSVETLPIGNITMETDYQYIDQSNLAASYPILEVDNLTPFGEYMGQSNNTYTNFKAGAQDPKWFTVKNVTTCPQSNNCDNDSVRQMHRLSLGRKTDFFASHFRARAAAAKVEAKAMDAAAAFFDAL